MTAHPAPNNAEHPPSKESLGNVFVVDDDRDMRRSLEMIFQEAGIAVNTFESPKEFLDYYQLEMRGCLVLDLELPGMSGLELQEALAERGCQLPFVMITGYGDVPRVIEAFRRGAVDFIEKPFRSEQLLSRVRKALASLREETRKEREQSGISKQSNSLTARERELMEHLLSGLSTKQAAQKMVISPKTAYVHRARVLEKMRVESVLQLMQRFRQTSTSD